MTTEAPPKAPSRFPANPLTTLRQDDSYHRRVVMGVLESYNGNYDVLIELIQNAVDAVEDAFFADMKGPFQVVVEVNLKENWLAVQDSGVGMSEEQVLSAFAPSVSFKSDPSILRKRGRHAYRGYKGVGLTFLAYGTDEIVLHSQQEGGPLLKGVMRNGRRWVSGEIDEQPEMVEDEALSPLEAFERGTYFRVQLTSATRPRSLHSIAADHEVWEVILRTRTAVGQVLLRSGSPVPLEVELRVVDTDEVRHSMSVEPEFLFPHLVDRKPEYRFLDVVEHWKTQGEGTEIHAGVARRDGIYLNWDPDRISAELTEKQRGEHKDVLERYAPHLYAFLPYQSSVWAEMNENLTGVKTRRYLVPCLAISINRQRMADTFDLQPSRFETLSRNLFVLVDFAGAKPDQGRKTVQDEVLSLAQDAADRSLQYLAKQRGFLKQAGESPSPVQREVELGHDQWIHNVRLHASSAPLDQPPIAYLSEPLTEQDVVGLFNQMAALGVFPGIKIFATSQVQKYDCLVRFDSSTSAPGLRFTSDSENCLGLSPYVLGAKDRFQTKPLTLEFKNNLDGLVEDVQVASESGKDLTHVDICVCWGSVSEKFKGYSLDVINEGNIDTRSYPGATHLLRRESDGHTVQIVMLSRVLDCIADGQVPFTED